MNRSLRRVLAAVVVVCGLFMATWLAVAASQARSSPPETRLTLADVEALASPEAPRPAPSGPAPRLVADSLEHDFGTVLQGEKVEHVFLLRNEGDRPAHIERVRTSCGCTATVLSTKLVPPGGSTRVQAVFSAGGARGSFRKSLQVTSDDPTSPLVLHVAGKVAPLYRVEPELTFFGRVAPGETERRTVRVVPARPDLPLTPGPIRVKDMALEVLTVRPLADPPGAWALDLVARPQKATDSLSGAVWLPTGNAGSPIAVIRVAGDVEGAK